MSERTIKKREKTNSKKRHFPMKIITLQEPKVFGKSLEPWSEWSEKVNGFGLEECMGLIS